MREISSREYSEIDCYGENDMSDFGRSISRYMLHHMYTYCSVLCVRSGHTMADLKNFKMFRKV